MMSMLTCFWLMRSQFFALAASTSPSHEHQHHHHKPPPLYSCIKRARLDEREHGNLLACCKCANCTNDDQPTTPQIPASYLCMKSANHDGGMLKMTCICPECNVPGEEFNFLQETERAMQINVTTTITPTNKKMQSWRLSQR